MELTLDEKCELIVNSPLVQEAEIRETERFMRIVWRNEPDNEYRARGGPNTLNFLVDDALQYITYLEERL